MDSFKCSKCRNTYITEKYLQEHIEKEHYINIITQSCFDPQDQVKNRKICEICKGEFSNQFGLNRHNKNVHNLDTRSRRQCRLLCPHRDCTTKLSNYKFLRGHLLVEHSVQIHLEVLEFTSLGDFKKWKEQVELETLSRYTLDTSPKKSTRSSIQKRYYCCHRSYSYRPKGNGLRCLKYMGSSKMGKACPARMEVTIAEKIGNAVFVKVHFFKTHLGHSKELEHVTLDKESRKEIGDMINEGHSFDDILKAIRARSIEEGTNQRLAHIRRKDLHNIARTFKSKPELGRSNVIEIEMEDSDESNLKCEYADRLLEDEVKETQNVEITDGIIDDDGEEEEYIILEDETHDSMSFREEIIKKANFIIKSCDKVEVSNEKCELILKYLDEVVNILDNKCSEDN